MKFIKFSFIFIFVFNLFYSVSTAHALERKLKVTTPKGTVYEQPCPNEDGMFEIYYVEDGQEYKTEGRCYATLRGEVGLWIPVWSQGLMLSAGVTGALQIRFEEWLSARLAGGFGGWTNGDNANGVTWFGSATVRAHLLDDVLRLGVGLGLDQQHLELTHKMQNYVGGGVVEAELELARHVVINGQLLFGQGGVYNGEVDWTYGLNLSVTYRF